MLISDFADWESAFLAAALNGGIDTKQQGPAQAKYTVKTMSITEEPVYSIGGFKVIPDYNLQTVPDDYAALILIGGTGWGSEQVKLIVPLVRKAIERKAIVGGICMASVFLGMHGFLNDVKHTSNTLELLKKMSGSSYTGEANYREEQATSDKNIVTANGTGYLEFTKEVLLLLEADTPKAIEEFYNFSKLGLCEIMKKK